MKAIIALFVLCVIACNAQDKKDKRGIADFSYGFPGSRISSRYGDPGFGPGGFESGIGGYQGMGMGYQGIGMGSQMGMGGFGSPYSSGVYGGSFGGFGGPGGYMGMSTYPMGMGMGMGGGYPYNNIGYRGFGGTPYSPIMSPSYPGQVVGPQLAVNGLNPVGY